MKIPIAEQVAQLTPEQKSNMGKIYKKYAIIGYSWILLVVISILACFCYLWMQEIEAKEKYDAIQSQIEMNDQYNEMFGTLHIDLSLYDKSTEALNEYYAMKQLKYTPLIVGGIIGLIGNLIIYLIFKRKYPYFSEAKCKYLKKNKQLQ